MAIMAPRAKNHWSNMTFCMHIEMKMKMNIKGLKYYRASWQGSSSSSKQDNLLAVRIGVIASVLGCQQSHYGGVIISVSCNLL
jgi:hypothetical protein